MHVFYSSLYVTAKWECEDGWVVDQVKGQCYFLSQDEDMLEYAEFLSKCPDIGAEPVTVRDEDDQSFITGT